MKQTLLLCIMDGVGIRDNSFGNALKNAHTPNLDYLTTTYPSTTIKAAEQAVGLPNGQMGNSEVGHTNIGAGRVICQPPERINHAIASGEFFENPNILAVINHTKQNDSKLHIMGLMSDGGVHSHINHLMALIDMCKQNQVNQIYLHMFTDGRDAGIKTGQGFAKQVKAKIKAANLGQITTISGRYYAMDRDNNYNRVQLAYDAIVHGIGDHFSDTDQVFKESYGHDITDEFIKPSVLTDDGHLGDNDGVIVFNFRPDRLREMCTAITNPEAVNMDTVSLNNIKLVSMMPITSTVIGTTAYDLEEINNVLGVYLDSLGLKQLRIAETEKYAHVTYFFDGGKEIELAGSKRILINSPKVATYDLKPDMSAGEITDTLIGELEKDYLDIVILNFANGDMVGHTGNYNATIKGVEFMDGCIGRLYHKIKSLNGIMVITADHGNCELMINDDGSPCTTHTTSPVPLIITKKGIKLKEGGKLADVAPTILSLMGLPSPVEMGGKSLIK